MQFSIQESFIRVEMPSNSITTFLCWDKKSTTLYLDFAILLREVSIV